MSEEHKVEKGIPLSAVEATESFRQDRRRMLKRSLVGAGGVAVFGPRIVHAAQSKYMLTPPAGPTVGDIGQQLTDYSQAMTQEAIPAAQQADAAASQSLNRADLDAAIQLLTDAQANAQKMMDEYYNKLSQVDKNKLDQDPALKQKLQDIEQHVVDMLDQKDALMTALLNYADAPSEATKQALDTAMAAVKTGQDLVKTLLDAVGNLINTLLGGVTALAQAGVDVGVGLINTGGKLINWVRGLIP